MARDCYTQVFKPTYLQAVADGLGSTVATAAAQSAMDDCLKQQSNKVPTVQPMLTTVADNNPDPLDRSALLGQLQK